MVHVATHFAGVMCQFLVVLFSLIGLVEKNISKHNGKSRRQTSNYNIHLFLKF